MLLKRYGKHYIYRKNTTALLQIVEKLVKTTFFVSH